MGGFMRSATPMLFKIGLIWLVFAAVIWIVPLTLVEPAARTSAFYYRLGWSEVLNIIFWGSCMIPAMQMLVADNKSLTFSAAPFIIILAFIYVVASFSLMMLEAYAENAFITRFHLAGQIVLFALFVIITVLLSIGPGADSDAPDELEEAQTDFVNRDAKPKAEDKHKKYDNKSY
jgi:hypothetical protein